MSAPQVWLRSAIEAAAGCEAYPLGVPEGLTPPYVVYTRTGTTRESIVADSLGDPAAGSVMSPVATVTIEVYRDDYVQVWASADAIVDAVHGYSGGDIEACIITEQRDSEPVYLEGRDTPTYVVEMTCDIRYQP